MLSAGVTAASLFVRTPALRDLIQASIAEMGLVLFGLSVGSMAGILSSSAIVRAIGARRVVALGSAFFVLGLATVGVLAVSGSAGVFAGLVMVGLGFGLSEIAINLEGAAMEAASGRTMLTTIHGFFSLGSVLGAGTGIAMTQLGVPITAHLCTVAVLCAIALALALPRLPRATGRTPADAPNRADRSGWRAQLAVWKQPRIVLLGIVVLCLALAEGSASDWLPLLMVDGHGTSPTAGSIVFTAFAVAGTIGRFLGAPLLARFGRVTVLRASALVLATGIAFVIFSDNILIAGGAVLLWGLGAALGFPVTLSAAGDSEDPTTTVSAVATAGYTAFLVGPPLLGFLGEHLGLRPAMTVVLAAVLIAATLATAARVRSPRRSSRLAFSRRAG